jgi:hypothetical protein
MPTPKNAPPPVTPRPKKTPAADAGKPPAQLIDARIAELGDWRGALLARLRDLILGAHAEITEEWKWNVPVWSCGGILCTGEVYKQAVKLTFPRGAALPDPQRLFNASLQGNARRAIDFAQDSPVNEAALQALVLAARAANRAKPSARAQGKA